MYASTGEINQMQITVTRHLTDGVTLSTIEKGEYIHFRYIGYTLKEAKQLFRLVVKERTKS